MAKNINFIQVKIFYFIILFILINSSFSYLYFNFPYAFELNNKNIFIIHQLGINICNSNFTEIIDTIVTFPESEKITTDEALSKVISVYEDNFIICLINDRIYIFNEEGYLLKKNDELITELNVEYYSLSYITGQGNYISFVIGFISKDKLYLFYYKYYIEEKIFNIVNKLIMQNSYTYNLINNGISCHYMKYNNYSSLNSYIFVCLFYKKGYDISLNFFDIYPDGLFISKRKESGFIQHDDEMKYIKAVLLPDKQHLFIGWLKSNGVLYYRIHNINGNLNEYSMLNIRRYFCKLIPHGFKINYYPEKNEIIYSCLLDNNNNSYNSNYHIFAKSFDVNLAENKSIYKYINCTIHGYSIIYLDDKKEYYIISDTN